MDKNYIEEPELNNNLPDMDLTVIYRVTPRKYQRICTHIHQPKEVSIRWKTLWRTITISTSSEILRYLHVSYLTTVK